MSNPNAYYNYYAAQSGSSRAYSSGAYQYQRNDTARDDNDAPQRNKILPSDNGVLTLQNAESLSNADAEFDAAASRKRNLQGLHQDNEKNNKRQQIEDIKLYEPSFVKDSKPVSSDIQHCVDNKSEISSSSWELSTPFRPSFALTRRLLSSVNRFSFIPEDTEKSIPGEVHPQNYGNHLVSVATDTPLISSSSELQNTIAAPKEEKISGYLKVYRDIYKEYVKELIKPTWHNGKLSREAHIMIAKRTVEKVMDKVKSLPASEVIDPLDDTLKQHIASYVEYYIDKYGKR